MQDAVLSAIKTFIKEREHEMFSLLERIVLINSHSRNIEGVNRVAAVLREALTSFDFAVETYGHDECGDTLVASHAPKGQASDARGVLLVGHMDTVFPDGDGFSCFRREAGCITGPGVIDMKGGLVVAVYALAALKANGLLDDMPVTFILNPDEEIGSPYSRGRIEEAARQSAFAFVFECSGLSGETVTGRKGRLPFTLKVTGPGGHAGAQGAEKPSAITEMARQILAVEALNNVDTGVSVNVGVVRGGSGPNVVPLQADASAEARYMTESDGHGLRTALEAVIGQSGGGAVKSRIEFGYGRPAMEQKAGNRALFGVAAGVAALLGERIGEDFRGGVSDANFIAAAGCPVLDGMGPSGERDHSHDEYMVASSLPRRAILAAATIAECWGLHRRQELFDTYPRA